MGQNLKRNIIALGVILLFVMWAVFWPEKQDGGIEAGAPRLDAISSVTQSTAPHLEYRTLREWKPNEAFYGLGLELVLEADEDSLTEERIRTFLRELAGNYDPVTINVYLSQEAYRQTQEMGYGLASRRGFLLNYTRNSIGRGDYARSGVILWAQEVGPFSHLLGQTVPL